MNDKLAALLKSRRFWVAVAGTAAVVTSEVFGVELDTEQVAAVAMIVVSWIIGDTIRRTE